MNWKAALLKILMAALPELLKLLDEQDAAPRMGKAGAKQDANLAKVLDLVRQVRERRR